MPDDTLGTKRRYIKLSEADWDTIASLYASGGCTLEDISERYGVSLRAAQSHVARRASAAATSTPGKPATVRSLLRSIPAPSDIEGRTAETRETAYLDAATMQAALLEAVAETADLPPAARIRALDMAAVALERLHKVRRLVLNMTADGDRLDQPLPDLPIRVLTDSEVNTMRLQQENEDEAVGVDQELLDNTGDDDLTDDEDDLIEEL